MEVHREVELRKLLAETFEERGVEIGRAQDHVRGVAPGGAELIAQIVTVDDRRGHRAYAVLHQHFRAVCRGYSQALMEGGGVVHTRILERQDNVAVIRSRY